MTLPLNTVVLGDCLEVLRSFPDASVDSVVTDPPAGISFMGRNFDNPDTYGVEGTTPREKFIKFLTEVMQECLRVLKPGGHALVWSLPRTSHWTATAIEDAGFEVRDCIHHIFGQGFPKSLSVGKALQKMGEPSHAWEGWGTALKPAVETWWLCRKPIEAQNVAAQVLATGTGAINVDGCRIGYRSAMDKESAKPGTMPKANASIGTFQTRDRSQEKPSDFQSTQGRWPSNLVLSHSPECRRVGSKAISTSTSGVRTTMLGVMNDDAWEPSDQKDSRPWVNESGREEVPVYECVEGCPVAAMDRQSGSSRSAVRRGGEGEHLDPSREGWRFKRAEGGFEDSGGASRFFNTFEPDYTEPFLYTGKASKADKNADLDEEGLINRHPTVKSQALCKHLVRLVTHKGGIVLDPFSGSGSTLVAAVTEGMKFVGIERDPDYHAIAKARTSAALERAETAARQREAFNLMDELEQE